MEEKSFLQALSDLLMTKNKLVDFLIGLGILACIFLCFVPCLIPIAVMIPLMLLGDKYFRKRWNIPEEYANNTVTGKPYSFEGAVSVGWLFLTGFEAMVSVFIILFHMLDMGTLLPLWVSLGIYIVLSFIILRRKYKKLQKWKMAGFEPVYSDGKEPDISFSPQSKAKPWEEEGYIDWDSTEEKQFDDKELSYTDEDSFAEENDEDPIAPEAYPGIPLEELKKLKELLDMEIITREEFEAKKKQMLGL